MDETDYLLQNPNKIKGLTNRMKRLEDKKDIKQSLEELKEHIKTLKTLEEKEDAALLYLMQKADKEAIGSEEAFFKNLKLL